MQIVIQSRGFALTTGLREHIDRRVRFALDWARFHALKVSVRLSDLNGPRGGEDKRCHIQVAIPGGADVLIEDTESDLYVAIDRAADRAGRTLARRAERLRDHRHDRSRLADRDALLETDAESALATVMAFGMAAGNAEKTEAEQRAETDLDAETETGFVLSTN
jgi:putative sigma-54 modulation protein